MILNLTWELSVHSFIGVEYFEFCKLWKLWFVNGTCALDSSARSARSGPVKVFAGSCQVPLRALVTFTLHFDGCVVNYI